MTVLGTLLMVGPEVALVSFVRTPKEQTTIAKNQRGALLERGLPCGEPSPAKGVTVVGEVPKVGKPGEKPYAHPRFWAAFVLIGDPN